MVTERHMPDIPLPPSLAEWKRQAAGIKFKLASGAILLALLIVLLAYSGSLALGILVLILVLWASVLGYAYTGKQAYRSEAVLNDMVMEDRRHQTFRGEVKEYFTGLVGSKQAGKFPFKKIRHFQLIFPLLAVTAVLVFYQKHIYQVRPEPKRAHEVCTRLRLNLRAAPDENPGQAYVRRQRIRQQCPDR